ncbi:hypothetical protein CWI39_0067p0030 [Hamiltosporidium magnivora]|uniref:Uncharacterized protein n=1 Tax=Hamiltosporidium magnivora TaxID=148818 RepID=A0A4V2JWW0_9MICR|nr:hypothetical protein CWI39_0067p0030 [Hamiltosporidium magnivora]
MRYAAYIYRICFLVTIFSSNVYPAIPTQLYSVANIQNQQIPRILTYNTEFSRPEHLHWPHLITFSQPFVYNTYPLPPLQRVLVSNYQGSMYPCIEPTVSPSPIFLPMNPYIRPNIPVNLQDSLSIPSMIPGQGFEFAQEYNMVTNSMPPSIQLLSNQVNYNNSVQKNALIERMRKDENGSLKNDMFQLLNFDGHCFIETNRLEMLELLESLFRKRWIHKLESMYPLLEKNTKLILNNVFDNKNQVAQIGKNIKLCVKKILRMRKYGIGFGCNLSKMFSSNILSIFYTDNLPFIYLKPIYLLLPSWIESVVYNDVYIRNNLFYISWCLGLMKAIMEYNYECLKPFISQNLEKDERGAISYLYEINKEIIYNLNRYLLELSKNIFEVLNKGIINEIFEISADLSCYPSHCDRIFSIKYIFSGIPGIIFDVFIFVSNENLEFLKSIILEYKTMKKLPENSDLELDIHMKQKLDYNSYYTSQNVGSLFYNIARVYETIFLDKLFFINRIKNSHFLEFDLWMNKNISNLTIKITNGALPKYYDYIMFLETCNLFLHYISKIVLNPNLTPKTFRDTISQKIINDLSQIYFH